MSLLTQASLVITPNGVKEGTLYSVIPSDGSGDMSVVRATTATRVNSAGLVELVPYNLVSYSEQVDNSAWTKENATISANAITAPNGTLTADLITSSSSSYSDILQGTAQSSGNSYTLSCYAKKGSSDWIFLRLTFAAAAPRVWFNVNTGAIGTIGSGLTATIESVGNGWFRCSISGTASATPPADRIDIALANADASTAPNVGNSVYVWGGQLVEGTLPKDYQKTETRLNIPRLDYSNGTCPSLLVEPQRTNLALYSSSFDNAAWDKINGTMTANATTAPDGNTTAEQWAGDGTNAIHDFYQAFTGGATTTSSIYVKKNTAQFVYISLNHQGTGSDWSTGVYDLDNLTTATFQSGGVTNQVATISDEGNGWRKITLKVSTGDTNLYCMYGIANSLSPSFGPNRGRVVFSTSASFYAWGAQLEAGSYPTSYIPTTSASVTRNADVVSKTGISSLIGQTEGTMFCDIYNTSNSNYGIVLSQTLGDYTNSIYFFNVGLSNQFVAEVFTGGVLQMGYAKGSTLSMGRNKIAITYKNNDFAVALNGVVVWADTLGSVPTTNNLDFTDAGIGSNYSYKVNAVSLWKTRLTNTQLAQLTTI